MSKIRVISGNVIYDKNKSRIVSNVNLYQNEYYKDMSTIISKEYNYNIETSTNINKLGVLLIGLGGSNSSTLLAGIHANKNKLSWETKDGLQYPNYYGSISQCSTIHIGNSSIQNDTYVSYKELIPMIEPENVVFGGWDINSDSVYEAMKKAKVLDINLQKQLKELDNIKPFPGLYRKDFIASNQIERANHIINPKLTLLGQVDIIRDNIKSFIKNNDLDSVIILWTANTERFTNIEKGIHDTKENMENAIRNNYSEISASTLYCYAALQEEKVIGYLNGSPQNTFIPGLLDMVKEVRKKRNFILSGSDFKTGQTKIKSVLVDFMVSAGLKPVSIVSYNHLGNNDGKNLNENAQFKSKELTKKNVIDDMVDSNKILYPDDKKPDHTVVIKYVPSVGDSKRALDEYTCEIFMNGKQTLVMHNTCEDSLLAAPILLDLIIFTELFNRVKVNDNHLPLCLPFLSYFFKAPYIEEDEYHKSNISLVNSLFRQKTSIDNMIRSMVGLNCESELSSLMNYNE